MNSPYLACPLCLFFFFFLPTIKYSAGGCGVEQVRAKANVGITLEKPKRPKEKRIMEFIVGQLRTHRYGGEEDELMLNEHLFCDFLCAAVRC